MLRNGYGLAEFHSISHILRKAPAQYGRAFLLAGTDGGDTTCFLTHQPATIRKAIRSLQEHPARKAGERRSREGRACVCIVPEDLRRRISSLERRA